MRRRSESEIPPRADLEKVKSRFEVNSVRQARITHVQAFACESEGRLLDLEVFRVRGKVFEGCK